MLHGSSSQLLERYRCLTFLGKSLNGTALCDQNLANYG